MKSIPRGIDMHVIVLTTKELEELVRMYPYRQLSDYKNMAPSWVVWQENDKWDEIFKCEEVTK